MEMQQIRYFLALAQTLNFTRAAEECNVTQPALTRAIQALEGELGGELIRRERQQSHLTELGRRMLPLLQQCYEASVSAKSLAKAVKTSAVAPLSIAVSNTVDLELLSAAIAELFRAYPGMRLKLRRGTPSEIVEILKRGEAELAIAGTFGDAWDRLDAWPIFTEEVELVVHASHPLASQEGEEIAAGKLAGHSLLSRQQSEFAQDLARSMRNNGIDIETAHEVESDQDLVALVAANAGLGFLPQTSRKSGDVRKLRVRDIEVKRTVAIYAVAGRMRSPVVTAMLNMLRSADWQGRGLSEPV
jgi:DNA-binding transcriptional LysR family regulator